MLMFIKSLSILLSLPLLLGCSSESLSMQRYKSADIYYSYWFTTTIMTHTPERLRRQAHHKITITDEADISTLHGLIVENDLAESNQIIGLMDVRLIVEFNTINSEKSTYIANVRNICSLSSETCRGMNNEYRDDLQNLILAFDVAYK